MNKKALKEIIQKIRNGETNNHYITSIVENYLQLGLKKNDLRKIVNEYEKFLNQNMGILSRDTSEEIKNHLKKTYGLKDIITQKNHGIDQTLTIQDTIYTFKVKDKLQKLIS